MNVRTIDFPVPTQHSDALEAIVRNNRVRSTAEVVSSLDAKPTTQPHRVSCFPTLDRFLEGIFADEFVCIHGSQGEGKTTLVLTLIAEFAQQGKVCYFYSLEETPMSIIRKYRNNPPAFYINDNMGYVVDYNVYPEHTRDTIKAMVQHFPSERLKLLYLDIIAMKAEGIKPDFIFIDFFHKLLPTSIKPGTDVYLLVAECLQTLVNTEHICIFVVNHDVKSAYNKRESSLADVRDSNWITSAARIVLSIKRPKDNAGKPLGYSYLKIEKHNREGSVIGNQIRLVVNSKGLLGEVSKDEFEREWRYDQEY